VIGFSAGIAPAQPWGPGEVCPEERIHSVHIGRAQANIIRWALDELVPPLLRDSPVLMWLPLWLSLGNHARAFKSVRDQAWRLDNSELRALSEQTLPALIQRKTDMTSQCVERVVESVLGEMILDVGCGCGYLDSLLSPVKTVVSVDLFARSDGSRAGGAPTLIADAEALPFTDSSFDTVVCTHVLEHVRQPQHAISELRRVAKRRVVIVVPLQRPYRYTFDTHLHFFPYPEMFLILANAKAEARHTTIRGDLLYVEDV